LQVVRSPAEPSEQPGKRLPVLLAQPGEDRALGLTDDADRLGVALPARGRQRRPHGAAVGRIGEPLDQVLGLQAVDELGDVRG
jgi:hypothetical protein